MAQHPYGQSAGPGPSWQPQPPPPPPAPRSNVGLVVVIVALAAVLLIAGAGGAVWFLSRSTTVTTTQPASEATCAGGDTVTDPQFTFKVPAGWCVDRNGPTVGLRTTTINVITVTKVPLQQAFDQTALCDEMTRKMGPHTKLPSIAWANRNANSYTVTSGIFAGPVVCRVDSAYQYGISGTVGGWGTMDEVRAGVVQVLAAWTWT